MLSKKTRMAPHCVRTIRLTPRSTPDVQSETRKYLARLRGCAERALTAPANHRSVRCSRIREEPRINLAGDVKLRVHVPGRIPCLDSRSARPERCAAPYALLCSIRRAGPIVRSRPLLLNAASNVKILGVHEGITSKTWADKGDPLATAGASWRLGPARFRQASSQSQRVVPNAVF
jgi:hypothetical protein